MCLFSYKSRFFFFEKSPIVLNRKYPKRWILTDRILEGNNDIAMQSISVFHKDY